MIGVIGDVHYGASYSLGKKDLTTGSNSRLFDYDDTLIYTVDQLVEKGCRYLVFTGDIFEHRNPTVKQQERFSAALRYAIEKGIKKIFIVVGNHDQQRITGASTLSYIKELPLENIFVFDEIDSYTVIEEGQPVANLFFLPYRDRKWMNVKTSAEAIEQIDSILSYHVSAVDNAAPKILVGHMTVEGTIWMLDRYSELYDVANELILPIDMFRIFNITIMGHVHTPGIVSKNPFVAYTGSMEKRGAFEDHDKKYTLIDLVNKKVSFLKEPCREIYEIKCDLSNSINGSNTQDIILESIDAFAKEKELKDSVVKLDLTLQSDDEKYCNPKDLESYFYSKYEVNNCIEIKPNFIFSRQSRDSLITETASNRDSFSRYINMTDDSHLKAEILSAGLEIIDHLGEE